MRKIGIFTKKKETVTRFQMVTERGNGFYSWDGKTYYSDIVRSCIRPKAKAISKLIAKHIRNGAINPEPYMRILLSNPNPWMSGQKLQEKLANQLALNNNAFAVITRDNFGYPVEIYPINCVYFEAEYSDSELFIKFGMPNGKIFQLPYSDIIHLRADYNENDIFGSPIAPALAPLMEVVTATDQGVIKAIKNSNVIRWLLKITQSQRPEDIKRIAKEFAESFTSTSSETGGVAATDAKAEAQQIKPNDYVPNAAQSNRTVQRIMSLLQTNTKIVQSSYTEDEWNAYYESEIEPVVLDLNNEYTSKLFSFRERGCGNKIVFEAVNLATASMNTKLSLWQMVDRGALTPNEWRATLNLAPLEGGDEPIRRLDTVAVKEATETNEN